MSLDNSPEKIDRRVLRTRESLREALRDLTQEKDYDEITVEEITERANVGRATFYLHYKDKEDLLMEEFNRLIIRSEEMLAGTQISVWLTYLEQGIATNGDSAPNPLEMIFQHIQSNKEFYYLLFNIGRSGRIIPRIRAAGIEVTTHFIEERIEIGEIKLQQGASAGAMAAYINGALVAMIEWWLSEDMSRSTKEMADLLRGLIFHGVLEIVELPPGNIPAQDQFAQGSKP